MLLFMDGFDNYSLPQATALGRWAAASGLSQEGTIVQYGVGQSMQDAANGYLERNIGQNLAAGCMGMGFYATTGAGAQITLFVLYDGSTIQMHAHMNADRTISIYRGSGLSNNLGTSTYTVPNASWNYYELKWKISDSISSGDVVLYVDGTAILTLAAGSDTKASANAYATKYRIGGDTTIYNSTTARRYMDNHYLLDFTGSYNNAPLGSVRVQTLQPTGNGNYSGMTGSDGNSVNNYQLVDETLAHNTDTDYVEHATAGTRDSYAMGDTLSTTGTIYAVQTVHVARKTDTDNKSFAPFFRISSTDYDGTTVSLTSSTYQDYHQIYETNPATSAVWTKSDVDGLEFGTKVVS